MEIPERLKDGKLRVIIKKRDHLLELVDIEISISSSDEQHTALLIEYREALINFTKPYEDDRSLLNNLKMSEFTVSLLGLRNKILGEE